MLMIILVFGPFYAIKTTKKIDKRCMIKKKKKGSLYVKSCDNVPFPQW